MSISWRGPAHYRSFLWPELPWATSLACRNPSLLSPSSLSSISLSLPQGLCTAYFFCLEVLLKMTLWPSLCSHVTLLCRLSLTTLSKIAPPPSLSNLAFYEFPSHQFSSSDDIYIYIFGDVTSLWDLSSPTRDQTYASCTGSIES